MNEERYRRFLWAKGDITLRETDFEPTEEQVAHGQRVLEEAIEEFKRRKFIWDPPV